MTRWDVAILGGGLAGLSIAARIAALPGGPRTLVIEPRAAYRRDRTWSYWDLHPHPFQAAATARWDRWAVRGASGATAIASDSAHPYRAIPADRFYDAAIARIAGATHVELRLGTRALGLEEGPDRVRVRTDRGEECAAIVLDSRPPTPRPGALAQRFLGQEVVTARPVFDPGVATLMDFDVPQPVPGAVRFLYLLPFSPTEALMEDTWIAPADTALPSHRAGIRAYLAARHGVTRYEILYEEDGAIPMDPDLAPCATARVVPVGTAGGAVKPSTGYAFLAVQRMADAIVGDLAAGRSPRPVPLRGAATRWMDRVFLSSLRENPAGAPALFHALFRRCSAPALTRFLNDLGSPAEYARVIAAMPKGPMLRAAAALHRPVEFSAVLPTRLP